MTTPRFVTSVRRLPGPLAQTTLGSGVSFTDEYVEGPAPGGRLLIRGVPTRTRGELHVVTGDRVTVMWTRGVPFMILNLASRKGSGHDAADEGGGVVEELFIAGDGGSKEVWFRNDSQTTNLNLRAVLGEDPLEVGWGAHPSAFYIRTSAHVYHVFLLSRPDRDDLFESTVVKATRQYVADPFDGTFALCTFASTDTLTGTNKYIDFTWSNVLDPGALLLGPANAYTKTTTQSGSLFLEKVHVDGQTNPPGPLRAPSMLVTGVTVDDALDLVITLSIALAESIKAVYSGIPVVRGGSELIPQLGAPFFTTDPLPINHGRAFYPITGSVDTGLEPQSTLGEGFQGGGDQCAIINARQRIVLFRSFKAHVTSTMTRKLDNFNYFKNSAGVLEKDVYTSPAVHTAYPSGHALEFGVDANPPLFTLTFDRGTLTDIPQIIGASSDVWDPAVVPFFDLPDTIFTETLAPLNIQVGARAIGSSGFNSDQYPFLSIYSRTRTLSNKSFDLAAVYVPRRATVFDATGAPVGLKLGKVVLTAVRQESPNPFTTPMTCKVGCFVRDLDTGATLSLQDLTVNTESGFGAGVNLVPPGVFGSVPTIVARQYVTVLGATLTHLLWERVQGAPSAPQFAEVLLSDITTGATKVLLTGSGSAGVDQLLLFVKKALQLLRPDFAYYPDMWKLFVDALDTKANNFVAAWDQETGAPTLDPSAPNFPEVIGDLEEQAILIGLPSGVVPQQDTVIAQSLGPVNIDQSKTGPSWHVVNNQDAIEPTGFFKEDE